MNYSNEYISKQDSTPFSCRISKEDKRVFQSLYPYCLSRFLKQCIKLAIKDKNFFLQVYFGGN